VAKARMVRRFTQEEIIDKLGPGDVTTAAVEQFYKEHASEYVRPETVRVSQILIRERAKAQKVLAAAKALPKSDFKAFRVLVARESEDADSKQRGGDLTQFDRATPHLPPAVVKAAFALEAVGDLSDLVSTSKGFVILKLTDHRPALSRTLEEVKPEIQRRLLDGMRDRRKRELVEEARKSVRVEIDEDKLAGLDLAAALDQPDAKSAATPTGQDAGAVVRSKP
jgi:parvulin-like peptidyl-prolyl isomerase